LDRHIWIQLENNPWDLAPNNKARMTGRDMEQIIHVSELATCISTSQIHVWIHDEAIPAKNV